MSEVEKPGLVFRRKTGESFVIFVDGIEIDVILEEITNKKASIRVKAPNNVKVYRSELLEEFDQ